MSKELRKANLWFDITMGFCLVVFTPYWFIAWNSYCGCAYILFIIGLWISEKRK